MEYAFVMLFVVAIAALAFSGETRQAFMNVMGKIANDLSVYLSGEGGNGGN